MQLYKICLILTFLSNVSFCLAYKPVIYMHGITAAADEADSLRSYVEKIHPGTNVTSIDAFNHFESFSPMWEQVDKIKAIVQPIFKANPDGVHMVCFSQGGLICRGLLSVLEHNVDTFIALSSPLAGQYGDTKYLKYLFPNFLKENIYKFFYSEAGQRWSVANYWHDPHEETLYRKYSQYLAVLDGESPNNQTNVFKENFLRLKNLVLVGGPNDGVITPWQSSHFGFYNKNNSITEMRDQEFYKNDIFGLQTLDKRGSIHQHIIKGIPHTHWYSNYTVFQCCIEPWLT